MLKLRFGQTPTEVTERCLESLDIKKAYIDWVLNEHSHDIESEYVYEYEDVYEEGDPIAEKEFDFCEEHVHELEMWLKKHEG